MDWFRRFKIWRKKIDLLEHKLEGAKKIELSLKQQQEMKERLFFRISSIEAQVTPTSDLVRLTTRIRGVAQQVRISAHSRFVLRQRIVAFIERLPLTSRRLFIWRLPRLFKPFIGFAVLFAFVLSSVLFFPFKVPVILAARSTYLEETYGEVFILRKGNFYPAQGNFSLQEGDVVITKAKSFATIRFFDDSTSRLGQNTQLELNRLYTEPFNQFATQIQVSLKEGRLWTRVLNLVDDHSQFVVDTDNAHAFVKTKAAFDIQKNGKSSTLAVFDNVVDFSSKDRLNAQTKPVIAGFQVEFPDEGDVRTALVVPLSTPLEKAENSDLWVQSNQERDKVHTEKLIGEKEDLLVSKVKLADVQSSSLLKDDKLLANPQIDKQRSDFLQSYQDLLIGEKLFIEHQDHEGMKLIIKFHVAVQDIMKLLPDFAQTDALNAGLLRSLVEEKIAQQRKDLATFLPGDPLYPVKEIMEETELFLTDSDVDRTLLQLGQAEGKLLEAQDLIEKGNVDLAQDVLNRYQRQIDQFVLQIGQEQLNDLKEKISAIFSKQVDQIKILTALEKSLQEGQKFGLLLTVREIRFNLLTKMTEALKSLPGLVPTTLLQLLKDFLQSYANAGVHDDEFILSLKLLLVSYDQNDVLDREVNVLQTQNKEKIPQDLGMVKVIENQTETFSPSVMSTL